MGVNRNRENLLGVVLADNPLVELSVDDRRRRNLIEPKRRLDLGVGLFLQNRMADLDTPVANVDPWTTSDQLLNFVLGILTEGATSGVSPPSTAIPFRRHLQVLLPALDAPAAQADRLAMNDLVVGAPSYTVCTAAKC